MSHTMNTRTTHQLCTRSGKRYQRPTQESHFSALPMSYEKTSQDSAVNTVTFDEMEEEPLTQYFSTVTLYHPNGEVEYKEYNFEEWQNEVKNLLRNTFEITDEEVKRYPFFEWFLQNH